MTQENRLYAKAYGRFGRAKPNYSLCCVEVQDRELWGVYSQCSKKRGHGPDGAYCKIHDPAAVEDREAKRSAKFEGERRRWSLQHAAPRFQAALVQIASGANDARSIAVAALKESGYGPDGETLD